MKAVVTAKEMAELDQFTISELGIPGIVLMENAGRGITKIALEMLQYPAGKHVVIFCGAGNNGGDGYVVARHLLNHGAIVSVYVLTDREKIKGDALINLKILENLNQDILFIDKVPVHLSPPADLVVDAMLGTGVEGALRGLYAEIAEWLDSVDVPVLSVDIPTGVNAETGAVQGPAVRATKTATMALPKRGLLFSPGREHTGELHIVDISMPEIALRQHHPNAFYVDLEWVREKLPQRSADAHKNRLGTVAVIAGGKGFTGAATMSSESALRSGAGLVYAIIPESLNPVLESKLTEVITFPVKDEGSGYLSVDELDNILEFIDSKTVVALGPGLGQSKKTIELVHAILSKSDKPLVVDADGLNSCQNHVQLLKTYKGDLVITPHPGEMSRLTGLKTKEIVQDRINIAKTYAKEWNCTLVLKGGPTVTANAEGKVFINSTGNAGMASAGSGDVLTGIIPALLAQGKNPTEAAVAAVFVHGWAGDLAAQNLGQMGMIAGDILQRLPLAFKQIME